MARALYGRSVADLSLGLRALRWLVTGQFVEMRQTVVYLRKFATSLRALDKDDTPLTEEELRELVAVYGDLPAPLPASAPEPDVPDVEDDE